MLMSALLVQLWHLQWYVPDEHRDAQLTNGTKFWGGWPRRGEQRCWTSRRPEARVGEPADASRSGRRSKSAAVGLALAAERLGDLGQ